MLDSSGSGEGPFVGSCKHGNNFWLLPQAWNFFTNWLTMDLSRLTVQHVLIFIYRHFIDMDNFRVILVHCDIRNSGMV